MTTPIPTDEEFDSLPPAVRRKVCIHFLALLFHQATAQRTGFGSYADRLAVIVILVRRLEYPWLLLCFCRCSFALLRWL